MKLAKRNITGEQPNLIVSCCFAFSKSSLAKLAFRCFRPIFCPALAGNIDGICVVGTAVDATLFECLIVCWLLEFYSFHL